MQQIPKFLNREVLKMGVPERYRNFEIKVGTPVLTGIFGFFVIFFLGIDYFMLMLPFSLIIALILHLLGMIWYAKDIYFYDKFELYINSYFVNFFNKKNLFKRDWIIP